MIEEVRPLRGHALHVGVLVLHRTGQNGVVDIPQLGDAAALVAIDDLLRRGRRIDDVLGPAEVLGDQLTLRDHQRFDEVRRQEAVLADDAGRQRQLGDAVRHDVEVRHGLRVLGHHLEETGVVDAVVVVVARVHVQGSLGNGPAADVQHVGEALADSGVKIFVHVGNALAGREVGRPEPGHRHARGHGGGRMLAFGLDEDQRPAGDIDVPGGSGLRPELAHLRGWCDRISAGAVRGFPLAHDRSRVAIHRGSSTGILGCRLFLFHAGSLWLRSQLPVAHFGE